MASLVNPYFNKFHAGEQNLWQGMVTECIQVMGYSMYYLPRSLGQLDQIMGEDVLSSFEVAIPVEMMYEDVQGWQNDKEIISKFGLEIRNDMTFLVSKPRWETEIGTEANAMLVGSRPQEGDLIFEPLSKSLFEIKFVDHDEPFFQVGKNYMYKLKCQLFQYSNEELNTGIADIDFIEDIKSKNLLDYQLLLQDGGLLLQEDGFSLFNDYMIGVDSDTPSFKDQLEFKVKSAAMNWSVNSPFGDE